MPVFAAVSNTFDDNRSVWWDAAAARGPYAPAPALAKDLDCDVAIVGGGFTGTSTAYHLARRFPEKRIVLCEARLLANGASGRNGGLVLNWVNGVDTSNLELARRIFDATRSGIDALEARIREHSLDVAFRRKGCLEILTDPKRAEAASREVERMSKAGIPLRFVEGAELARLARFEGAAGAILDPTAGQIDGVSLVRAMRPLIEKLGVHVYEGTPVLGVDEGETIALKTPNATIRAKAIVLATNAYTPRLGYFGSGIVPLHSHLVSTEPLSPDEWEELGWGHELTGFSDDLDRIAYGGMTVRGELVFGGGSNAAYGYGFGNGTVYRGDPQKPFEAIERTLHRYLPKAAKVRIAHRWTGPVALTMSRVCTMGVRGKHRNVYFALGYSGHGITLANMAGEVLTDIYSGDDARWRDLPFYQQKLLFVPPEPFRWVGYHAYTAMTGRSPRRALR
ncbi:MAG: FAD-dependent oxidoreductase [Labilithrix sp.]|nr:FAD-dependent oxidoreductase [Labilithrix sp.]